MLFILDGGANILSCHFSNDVKCSYVKINKLINYLQYIKALGIFGYVETEISCFICFILYISVHSIHVLFSCSACYGHSLRCIVINNKVLKIESNHTNILV